MVSLRLESLPRARVSDTPIFTSAPGGQSQLSAHRASNRLPLHRDSSASRLTRPHCAHEEFYNFDFQSVGPAHRAHACTSLF